MENLTYKKEQVERVLNIVNSFTFQGVSEASKIIEIFNILNSFIKDEEKTEENKAKFDDGHQFDDGAIKFD
jgi:hypothetical protein